MELTSEKRRRHGADNFPRCSKSPISRPDCALRASANNLLQSAAFLLWELAAAILGQTSEPGRINSSSAIVTLTLGTKGLQ